MSTPTITTRTPNTTVEASTVEASAAGASAVEAPASEAEFDLDIRIFESGVGLDEVIRMTDDGCGVTCQSACNSC